MLATMEDVNAISSKGRGSDQSWDSFGSWTGKRECVDRGNASMACNSGLSRLSVGNGNSAARGWNSADRKHDCLNQ